MLRHRVLPSPLSPLRIGRQAALTLAVLLAAAVPAHCQFGGGGGLGGGGLGGGGLGGGGGTIGTGGTSGVAVDADGVLRTVVQPDPTGEVARQRAQEAWARLDADVAKRSPLRKVSLTRLEKVLAEHAAQGASADHLMEHLAGLTRIEYVFCYPETGDIVVAGPAEAWAMAPSGRMQGLESGRPVLLLEDLVVALRAFPPGGHRDSPLIYCSIDPTPEGLANMQQFLRQHGSRVTPTAEHTQFIVEQLRNSLGQQVISVGGVSPSTHFAQVMVEADYRMKLIGIDLEEPPVRLKSYVERANPSQVSRNALTRWFFVPDYECVRVSEDALAMRIEGEGVKLVGEDEVVAADGARQNARSGNRASQAFVNAFTKVYPKLAEQSPVYAQLRNCIDLAVAAAFIQNQDYYGLVGWQPQALVDEAVFAVEKYNAPRQVASAVNAIWKGTTLMTPIGGGVQMRPTLAVAPTSILEDAEGDVSAARVAVELAELDPHRWWWD
jgi:hypothetical protein